MVLRNQINNKTMFYDFNVRVTFDRINQGPFHFLTGNIFMMKYTELAMTALFAKFIIPIGFFIELRP